MMNGFKSYNLGIYLDIMISALVDAKKNARIRRIDEPTQMVRVTTNYKRTNT
jgi:hypothetical protein